MRFLFMLCGALFAIDAAACYVPPPEQTVPAKELIARTANIVLAKVTKAELIKDHEVRYTFKLITTLAGRSQETFTLLGYPAIWEDENTTFNHHADPTFWSDGGRTTNDTDCQIHPTFSIGGTYLMFLDRPYHWKSFEHIVRLKGETRDKWLQYVESSLRK